MIPDIFRNRALQEEFNEQGFVKIQLLNEEDILLLNNLFPKFHHDLKQNKFESSTFLTEKVKKLEIRAMLYPIFLPYFERIFKDYTYIGSSFLYKTKGIDSEVAPHQDWTIVDEKKYVAINIWTPLIDTNEQNGTLFVLPQSQAQKYFTLRAPTIPFHFQNKIKKIIKESIPTNAKAGEAVILNQSLIHYSTPNYTDNTRIAITSGIKTKNAPMIFHYKNEKGQIEKYSMPEDFLSDFQDFKKDIYQRPQTGIFLKNISNINLPNKNTFFSNSIKKIKKVFNK